jgi:hypothetical protein
VHPTTDRLVGQLALRPRRKSHPRPTEVGIRCQQFAFTNRLGRMSVKGMRMKDDFRPAVVAIVEVLVRFGRLIERQLM